MKWVIPLADHDFSGLLDALRARPAPKAPVFPEDFKEYRPFWTGLVELRRPKIGDEVSYVLSFLKDRGARPMRGTIKSELDAEGGVRVFVVEDSQGPLKVYESEIVEV